MHTTRLRDRLNRAYTSQRDVDTGIDAAITERALLQFVSRKVVEKIRAVSRGCPQAFLGRHTRIRNRQDLTLGAGVVIGDFVEIVAMARQGVVLGEKCTLDRGAVLRGSGGVRRLGVGIRLGDRVSVGVGAMIHGGGGVEIGSHSFVSPYARIFTEHHAMDDLDTPVIEQGEFSGPVVVGADVFIGSGATILGPCSIGDGAVIAAGSVVTGDVDAAAIVAGVPARVIGQRGARSAGATEKASGT
jgi:acetyltransferase-like isoleucine patch superfamily enzyme